MIAHLVLFEPKSSSSTEEREAFLRELRRVIGTINEVQHANIGTIFSLGVMPENLIGGSTYSYASVIEFSDKAGLERYLKHPVHDELRRLFWTMCERTVVADAELFDARSGDADNLVK